MRVRAVWGMCALIWGQAWLWSSPAAGQTDPFDLQLWVGMAGGQVTLDSGYTKRHVDSVVYINPTYDTVYHVEGVDTVAYLMPDAVQRVGIWGQPGPNGGPKPNYDNDFILYFETIAERDSAYEALSGRDEVL